MAVCPGPCRFRSSAYADYHAHDVLSQATERSLSRRIHDAREGLFERASQELHAEKSYFDD